MKNKFVFLFIVFSVLTGLLYFIYSERTNKEKLLIEQTRKNERRQFIQDSIRAVKEGMAEQKRIENEINRTELVKRIANEKFLTNVNSSIVNSSKVDVAVIILDEGDNITTSFSNSIADVYNRQGKSGSIGLFRNSFVHEDEFDELCEGNPRIIEQLKLKKHTDYIVIGKLTHAMRQGTLARGTIVCNTSINVKILSASQKIITKSFSFSVNGNGVTESQAKEDALEKLLTTYNEDYSSI